MDKNNNSEGNPDIFAAVAGENLKECTRREAYACDVVYGTNNEFGFDYLRDNMADFIDQRVQRGTSFAIVDEVDNILIDEARTPLIISGPAKEQSSEYKKYARIAKSLKNDIDFEIEEKRKNIILSDTGISKIEKSLGVKNLYDPENEVMSHFAENAVRAENVYQKNREYVVQNKELIIVDDGSTDETVNVVRKLEITEENFDNLGNSLWDPQGTITESTEEVPEWPNCRGSRRFHQLDKRQVAGVSRGDGRTPLYKPGLSLPPGSAHLHWFSTALH